VPLAKVGRRLRLRKNIGCASRNLQDTGQQWPQLVLLPGQPGSVACASSAATAAPLLTSALLRLDGGASVGGTGGVCIAICFVHRQEPDDIDLVVSQNVQERSSQALTPYLYSVRAHLMALARRARAPPPPTEPARPHAAAGPRRRGPCGRAARMGAARRRLPREHRLVPFKHALLALPAQ
jgi:hypothetical protein